MLRKCYENITITLTNNNDGTYTASSDAWSDDVTVEGTITSGTFKYKWTEANNLYNYAPPAATFENSAVKCLTSRPKQ